jgi:hypothetical protein
MANNSALGELEVQALLKDSIPNMLETDSDDGNEECDPLDEEEIEEAEAMIAKVHPL